MKEIAHATYAHIRRCPDECIGNRVDKLSGNAKIAYLDLPGGVHEDVGGFDVSVDDLQCM